MCIILNFVDNLLDRVVWICLSEADVIDFLIHPKKLRVEGIISTFARWRCGIGGGGDDAVVVIFNLEWFAI